MGLSITLPVRKILIVRLSALGDILHAIPAQQALHQRFPDAEIHWLTEKLFVPLVSSVTGVTRVWEAGVRDWAWTSSPPSLVRMLGELRRERFDLAFDFQGLTKSALLTWLSGARKTIGLNSAHTREHFASAFYSFRASAEPDQKLHVIDLNLSVTAQLGAGASDPPSPPIQVPDAVQRAVDDRLRENGIREPVLINPGAGWHTKMWPAEEYASVGERIEKELKLPVIITYGPGEEAIVERMQNTWSSGPFCSFPTSIMELAALCRRASLMIAGDTGPLHLAVAMGTPTVAIMGPTTPWRNGPYNPADVIVQRRLPCSNCYKRKCDNFVCMNIPSDEVYEAVRSRLKR
jgi:lipopolysaccharide heptosyltransferase I